MRLMAFAVGAALFGALAVQASALEVKWVKANDGPGNKSCQTVCQDSGGNASRAVRAGIGSGTPYFVCAAEADGLRPGWQISGAFGNACDVSYNGQGQARQPASCLCSSEPISAQ